MRSDNTNKWFQDRIGETVFRNKNTCPCKVCKEVYENGVTIANEFHASYLHDCTAEFGVNYFDTKEEVLEFEKSIKVEV